MTREGMDPDEREALTERLHAAIQKANESAAPPGSPVEGALLVNWCVVAEWASTDGERWMTHLFSPQTTIWMVKGLLQETLDGVNRDQTIRDLLEDLGHA